MKSIEEIGLQVCGTQHCPTGRWNSQGIGSLGGACVLRHPAPCACCC